jgi:O-antigen/teichoic acid export membrane protein
LREPTDDTGNASAQLSANAQGVPGSPANAEPAVTLGSTVARGSTWTLLGYGSGQALRLLSNLILWRLLYSEAFGLMALVNVFMSGLVMFSDIGIGPSIVQSSRGEEPRYLNTAWTIQIVRGCALFIAACLLAWPIALFYNEPQLVSLIPVAALGAVISGFNSTSLFTQTRKIHLGKLTAVDILSQTVSLVVTIAWAWFHRSVWALVIGGFASNFVRLFLSHKYLPGIRNRLQWDKECVHALLRFGRWIFLSTLLTFTVMQSDRLIFGKLIPIGLLGVYSIAVAWATLPIAIVGGVLGSVLFPLLSRLHQSGTDFSAAYLKARRPWAILGGWASAGLIAGGPTLIRLLYDSRATSAGWVIQILAAGTWLLVLETSNGVALLALGQPKWVAAGNAAKLVGMLVLIPLGFSRYGFAGAVAGFAASELFRYTTSVVGSRRHKVACLRQDLYLTSLVMVTSAIGLLAAHVVLPRLSSTALPAKVGVFLAGLCIAVAVSVGWAWVYLRGRASRPQVG